MKHFFFTDGYNPIYFDHPDGRMLCLPIATTQDLFGETFKEEMSCMRCDDALYVFQQYDGISSMVVSDQGEEEVLLRRELQQIYELLLFMFGPDRLKQRNRPLIQHQRKLQRVIDTMCALAKEEQSFLVQAIEKLQVNEDIHSDCIGVLKGALDTHMKEATHAMIFVGNKLLVLYGKTRAHEIQQLDLFMLVLYFQALFHPRVRQYLRQTELPVADYTDHEAVLHRAAHPNVSASDEPILYTGYGSPGDGETMSSSDDFVSAPEEWDDERGHASGWTCKIPGCTLCSPARPTPFAIEYHHLRKHVHTIHSALYTLLVKTAELPGDAGHLGNGGHGSAGGNLLIQSLCKAASVDGVVPGSSPGELVVVLQFALHASTLYDGPLHGRYDDPTAAAVARFQEFNRLQPTGVADLETLRLILKNTRQTVASAEIRSYGPRRRHSGRSRSVTNSSMATASDDEETTTTADDDKRESSLVPPSNDSGDVDNGDVATANIPIGLATEPSGVAISESMTSVDGGSHFESPMSGSPTSSGFVQSANTPEPRRPPPPPPRSAKPAAGSSTERLGGEAQPAEQSADEQAAAIPRESYEQLYFRTVHGFTPRWVYFSQLDNDITLIVITKNTHGTEAERAKLSAIQTAVRDSKVMRSYRGFFIAKEQSHVTMVSGRYLHHFPGLVHFIFIDRLKNEVFAPTIAPLYGQQSQLASQTTNAERIVAILREQIWQMVQQGLRSLSMGSTSLTLRHGAFLYSYRLWVEDSEGVELPLVQAGPTDRPDRAYLHNYTPFLVGLLGKPLGPAYYTYLVKKLFPSTRGLRCFELYTLYLGAVSLATVAQLNRALVQHLLKEKYF